MAQKIKPYTFRLGITIPWASRWFFKNTLKYFLEEDYAIRTYVKKKILEAGVAGIDIERTSDVVRVNIRASRPGLIIGRGGKGVEDLRNEIMTLVRKLRTKNKIAQKCMLNVNIEELKRSEVSAPVVAQQIAFDIQKRLPYRRVMKRHLESMMQNNEVKGAKIKLAGRLNGAEISRSDFLAQGRMPLQSFRANIDYAEATAFNSYGTVGVKVWIYKGDVFAEKKEATKVSYDIPYSRVTR